MAAGTAKIRALVSDLPRRLVFRVAALYIAAVVVLLEFADTAFPALNFPDWVTRFVVVGAVLGFPLALALAWGFERSAPARKIPRSSSILSGSLVSPTVLAVIPFAVRGAKDYRYLSEGMVELLSSKLQFAGELRTVDPHALLSFGRERGVALDPAHGKTTAEHFGARIFLLGNVIEAGGRLHLDATLYEVGATPRVVTETMAEGAAADLFEHVDSLARQVLAGISIGPTARLERLAATTTDSFRALKFYLEGESAMRAMRRAPAIDAFQRALEEDPSFALAWYRLSVAALWSGQLELSRDSIEHATALSDRLALHERQLVDAFSAFLRGHAEEAERLYRAIVGNHPDDVEAWYQLAEVLFHYRPRLGGSILESRAAWERVLDLEPEHVSALLHMAVIAAVEQNSSEVDALVRRALKVSPEGDGVWWMRALRAAELGDRQEHERVIDKVRSSSDFIAARAAWVVALPSHDFDAPARLAKLLTETTRSTDVRALGHVWLAHLELARGRWSAAREQLRSVEALHSDSAVTYNVLMTLAPFLETSESELQELQAVLRDWDAESVAPSIVSGSYFTVHNGLHPQLRQYLLGVLAARLHDDETARAHAEALERTEGRPEAVDLAHDQARSIHAHINRNQGRESDALGCYEGACMGALSELAMASPFFSQTYERYRRGELLCGVGRHEDALRWFGSFAEHSIFDLIYLAPSHLRQAEIYEHLGDLERAAHHYERFLKLWRECDPDLRHHVEGAKNRLAGLAHGAADR